MRMRRIRILRSFWLRSEWLASVRWTCFRLAESWWFSFHLLDAAPAILVFTMPK
jgi:hypothetical protein